MGDYMVPQHKIPMMKGGGGGGCRAMCLGTPYAGSWAFI